MKNTLYLLVAFAISSCGGGGDTIEETSNSAPGVPNLSSPTNNQLCITNTLNFQWGTSNDPDGDNITYVVEIATDNQFSTIVKGGSITQTNKTFELTKGVAYYWRVKAKDTKGNESNYSSTWNFYTEGDAIENHLPFMPNLVAPLNYSSVNTTTTDLQWSCSDIDNDVLSYDIYFGTTTTPTLVQSAHDTTTYNVTLTGSTTYYWKIDAIDSHNNKTLGTVWSFETN